MSNNDSALHQPPPAPSPSPPPPPPPSSHHPFNVQLRKHLTATHKSADPLDSAALHDDAAAQSSPAAAGNNSAAGNASSDDTEFTRRWRSGPRYAADRRNSRSAENLPSMMLTAIGDRFGGNIGIGGVIRSASGSDGDGARRKNSVPDAFNGELLQTLLKIGKDKNRSAASLAGDTTNNSSVNSSCHSTAVTTPDQNHHHPPPPAPLPPPDDVTMMPPLQSQPSNVPPPPSTAGDQSGGLIAPKKLHNPCLESADRKNLHRELMFNQKIGKSVLNQKSELQKALQKQKERQQLNAQLHDQHQQLQQDQSLSGELSRAIMQRAQRLELSQQQNAGAESENDHQLNAEYMKIRAKLRATADAK